MKFSITISLLLFVSVLSTQTAKRSDGAMLTPEGNKMEITVKVTPKKATTLFSEFTLDNLPMTITVKGQTIEIEGKRGEYKVDGVSYTKSSDAKKAVRDKLRLIYNIK